MISPCIALAGNIDLLIAVSDNILTADIILIPAYRDRLFLSNRRSMAFGRGFGRRGGLRNRRTL